MKNKELTYIESIKIIKLFEIFDYDIVYPKNENVLIITGPNGFGKTQVLNIIFNLFSRKFTFFHNLVFEAITIVLNNNRTIEIVKEIKNKETKKEKIVVTFLFKEGKKNVEEYIYDRKISINLSRNISRYLPFSRISNDSWINNTNDQIFSLEEILEKYSDQLPSVADSYQKLKTPFANKILNAINVHLIREQRLFTKVSNKEARFRDSVNQNIMTETIQTYSDELKGLILEKSQDSYTILQSLDSSYPNRLISEKNKISKDEYNKRFTALTDKQEKLTNNGLYESKQEVLDFSEDDSKALLVYLNDLEKKLEVFDDLLEKLELFTNILNERRFTFKSIYISKEKGFYFKTVNDKDLKLNQLSSGEQHEVVLLYELIFKTKPNILVLIDEPEISLHITWQKEFLDDLLKIIQIQKFQVLVATHSPSIINDRWDLVYNLEKRTK